MLQLLRDQGGQYEQEWQRWGDHPVRKEYDVIMDLGEGAFSQVNLPLKSTKYFYCNQDARLGVLMGQCLATSQRENNPTAQSEMDKIYISH